MLELGQIFSCEASFLSEKPIRATIGQMTTLLIHEPPSSLQNFTKLICHFLFVWDCTHVVLAIFSIRYGTVDSQATEYV